MMAASQFTHQDDTLKKRFDTDMMTNEKQAKKIVNKFRELFLREIHTTPLGKYFEDCIKDGGVCISRIDDDGVSPFKTGHSSLSFQDAEKLLKMSDSKHIDRLNLKHPWIVVYFYREDFSLITVNRLWWENQKCDVELFELFPKTEDSIGFGVTTTKKKKR
ncbi:hypothetical protein [Nodularia sphaerocarpa]|uniref:hypothetical protein n=1 Tax=Nodularia sphaerocarpa TaxID=137816 RepID=UPI001EFC2B4B|nr:hypothetical protein [Nodularia sphaerocarpa]MDB9374905.1 hypothetical protein [Nodularia sphaerocarpa CS-585]MDB9378961.1 hypothetical protein [Nodularia sphaerocarpa CS-585A2]ULP71564.1 hypothetical protein BDGGKGIB_01191 [Nodularia sphaerocarpa UHCC 0038]